MADINKTGAEVANIILSVGDKSNLQTQNKNTLVDAINEVKEIADEGGNLDDVEVNGDSVVENRIARIDLTSYALKDWVNLQGFIKNTVDNLINYFSKEETYSKAQIQSLISAIKQFEYVVVQVLPTASASTMNKIYLVPSSSTAEKNIKDEYITIESSGTYSWEQIGSTSIDLSNYYTKTETDAELEKKQKRIFQQSNAPSNPQDGDIWIDTDEEGTATVKAIDSAPTQNSQNLVTSGGVYEAIQQGGGEGTEEIFVAEYEISTFEEIQEAVAAGKIIFVLKDNYMGQLVTYDDTENVFSFLIAGNEFDMLYIDSSDSWTMSVIPVQYTNEKVTSISSSSTDSSYPSAKAVVDYVGTKALPEVTSEDNGKILQVVNGEWQLVSLDSWTGGNF